jgi:hypothetical protein
LMPSRTVTICWKSTRSFTVMNAVSMRRGG